MPRANAEKPLEKRARLAKPARANLEPQHRRDVIGVVFQDGLELEARGGKLYDGGRGVLAGATHVLATLGGQWRPVHSRAREDLRQLRLNGQGNGGEELPDLSLQFYLRLPKGMDPGFAIDQLNTLDIVERAMPVSNPAPPPTPNFTSYQRYLQSAPTGLDFTSAWNGHDEHGEAVRYVDIEYMFNTAHHDLPRVNIFGGRPNTEYGPHHGTAVLGVISMLNNGWGGTGAAYAAIPNFSYAHDDNDFHDISEAISRSWSATTTPNRLQPGDVIIVEQQMEGPNRLLVPAEWDYFVYSAIKTAVANGYVVVAAAGNNEPSNGQNLDNAIFAGTGNHYPFTRSKDSGSILVGAGVPSGTSVAARSRLGYSNYGSTVDLQGWGERVFTTAGVDRYGFFSGFYTAEGVNRYFTESFSGTSAATPLVASAAILLQSAVKRVTGCVLPPATLKDHLRRTGQAQTSSNYPSSQNIGPLPNLAAAFTSPVPLPSWRMRVNFQPSTAVTPSGYLKDDGSPYGARNYQTYGWTKLTSGSDGSKTVRDGMRDRNNIESPDQRYDTLAHMQHPTYGSYRWDMAVANGNYVVTIVAGDPSAFDSNYVINAEGVTVLKGAPNEWGRYIVGTKQITVSDGKLTISNGSGSKNNKIAFLEVVRLSVATADVVYDVGTCDPATENTWRVTVPAPVSGYDGYHEAFATQALGGWFGVLDSTRDLDQVIYRVPWVPAGTYEFRIQVKRYDTRGYVEVSTSHEITNSSGQKVPSESWTNHTDRQPTSERSPIDLYRAPNATYPSEWGEETLGLVTFTSSGPRYVRMRVKGVNSANTSGKRTLAFDWIKFRRQ